AAPLHFMERRLKLIAKKGFRYAGRSLVPGDEFEASAKDARLLKAIKRASDLPESVRDGAPHELAGTAFDPHASGHERQGRKGNYRTQRLKAGDVGNEDATNEDKASEDDATEE